MAGAGALLAAHACHSTERDSAGLDADAGGADDAPDSAVDAAPPCPPEGCGDPLRCETTISGTVYDPAGKNPIFGVVVLLPTAPVSAFTPGVACGACGDLFTGAPRSSARTDTAGHFVLPEVRAGVNVPIVVQIGKWRRQFTVPSVVACVDNPQPEGSLRLPRSQGEGDLPEIAISTGGADSLECFLRRVGVDESEFVAGPGAPEAGHVHVFQGSAASPGERASADAGVAAAAAPNTLPPAPASAAALWDRAADINAYDVVLLACEGAETQGMNRQVLFDYASAGGIVIASHFQYAWLNGGPFAGASGATFVPGTQALGAVLGDVVTSTRGAVFSNGVALKQWLGRVDALSGGELPMAAAFHNADVDADAAVPPLVTVSSAGGAAEYLSFPLAGDGGRAFTCGGVLYADVHAGAAAGDDGAKPVPTGCAGGGLTADEKVLEFFMFQQWMCRHDAPTKGEPPP